MATFDQRNQRVNQQTNISIESGISRLIDELRSLVNQVQISSASNDQMRSEAVRLRQHFERIEMQISKKQVNAGAITESLRTMRSVAEGVAGNAAFAAIAAAIARTLP